MKPTEKQIELAERLQKAGFFVECNLYKCSCEDGGRPYEEGDTSCKFCGGQLYYYFPTFEEVWDEIQPIIEDRGFHIQLNSLILAIEDAFGKSVLPIEQYPEEIPYDKSGGVVGALIEALLYLHGEKQ